MITETKLIYRLKKNLQFDRAAALLSLLKRL